MNQQQPLLDEILTKLASSEFSDSVCCRFFRTHQGYKDKDEGKDAGHDRGISEGDEGGDVLLAGDGFKVQGKAWLDSRPFLKFVEYIFRGRVYGIQIST